MGRILAWAAGHKILTAVLVLLLAGWAMGTDETSAPTDEAASSSRVAEPQPTPPPLDDSDDTDDGTDDDAPGNADEDDSAAPSPTDTPSPTEEPEPRRRLYPVVEVVDGDSVKVAYDGGVESIRIIGIDTPETVHPSVPDECWGPHASGVATELLTGKSVALVRDPSQGDRDSFGRLLAYVEVPGLGDFGLAMIRRGHAIEYTYDTAYRRQSRYRAAEEAARGEDLGMWRHCGGPDKPLAPPPAEPQPFAQQPKQQPQKPKGNCAPGYSPCVPPAPPDLDCADVDGPITVTGDDPHRLDADGDGTACE